MEIPPNILKELEEKKARALLDNSDHQQAANGKSEAELASARGELVESIAAPEKLISPILSPYIPLGPDEGAEGGERGGMGGEMFFGLLVKVAVYLAVFLTPLFFFSSSDTVNLPKQMLLSVLALAAVLGWAGQMVVGGRFIWKKNILVWPAGLIALSAALSSFFSNSFWISFLGDAGRYSTAGLSTLSYFVILIAAMEVLHRKDLSSVLTLWVTSTFLVSLYSLLQFLGIFILRSEAYKNRIFNPVGGSFGLSLFMLAVVPFLVVLIESARSRLLKLGAALLIVFEIAVAYIIDFQLGWIALLGTLLILMLVGFKSGGHYQKKVLLPLALIILTVALWFMTAPQIKNLTFQPEINPSYASSLNIMLKTWKEHLVFGSGLETFPYVYAKFKSPLLNQTNYWGVNFNDANAEVLTWATTAGVFGAAAWLAFVMAVLVMGLKRKMGEGGWETGLFASWIFILISKFLYPTPLALEFMFWLLPGLFLLAREQHMGFIRPTLTYKFQSGSTKTLMVFFGLMMVLLAALSGIYFSVKRWQAEGAFVKAVIMSNATAASDAAEKRDEVINSIYIAISQNPYETRYFRVLAQALFAKMNDVVAGIRARPEAERRAKPEESAQLQDLTVRTINSIQRSLALDPDNVAVMVDSAESYKGLVPLVQGADDLAIQNYEKAAALEPINPFIKTQLAQLYLIKSNLFNSQNIAVDNELVSKSKSVLDEALKLNPNYANAAYFYALIQDKEGDKQGALKTFSLLAQANPDNQLLKQIITNLQSGYPALGLPPQPATPPQSPKAVETKGLPLPARK